MTEPIPAEVPTHDGRIFRAALGLIVMLTAIGGFAALFVIRVPSENKDAMMFALGSVFGWAASIVASEYGASSTGRKVADSAIRNLERQDLAATAEPLAMTIDQPAAKPVPVEEKDDT